jgi:hypothetical protein
VSALEGGKVGRECYQVQEIAVTAGLPTKDNLPS